MITPVKHGFLGLPPEILLRVLDYLYINQEVCIKWTIPELPGEIPTFQMQNVPMSAQLIRVCQQLHRETHVLLYANNAFNCAARDCLKLLLHCVGSKNFSSIKHIIIDWEQLQDFAWALAKEDYNAAMSGLEVVELATWRTRMLGGSSSIWRQSKRYERQLCQSANDICEKHPKLKVVAQRTPHKLHRVGSSHQVKWRFITSRTELRSNEIVVPISDELRKLKESEDSEAGGGGAQEMIDPF